MSSTSARPSVRFFESSELAASASRQAITAAYRLAEPEAVQLILAGARLPPDIKCRSQPLAEKIARTLRDRKSATGRAGVVQNLLQEYALSSQEGVALMCLAEALLR